MPSTTASTTASTTGGPTGVRRRGRGQLRAVAPEGSGGSRYGPRLRKVAEGGSYGRWRRKGAEGGAPSALVLRARSERQVGQERAPTPSKRMAGALPTPRSGPARACVDGATERRPSKARNARAQKHKCRSSDDCSGL